MRAVIQRVNRSSVEVEGKKVGRISKGLLLLVGFVPEDAEEDFHWMAKKICGLRIFNDEALVMNLSVKDIDGELLVVSQFTLHALTKKGNRPSYILASKPEIAKVQYEDFLLILEREFGGEVQKGIFGADMKVDLLNDGPVTIIIDSKEKR